MQKKLMKTTTNKKRNDFLEFFLIEYSCFCFVWVLKKESSVLRRSYTERFACYDLYDSYSILVWFD